MVFHQCEFSYVLLDHFHLKTSFHKRNVYMVFHQYEFSHVLKHHFHLEISFHKRIVYMVFHQCDNWYVFLENFRPCFFFQTGWWIGGGVKHRRQGATSDAPMVQNVSRAAQALAAEKKKKLGYLSFFPSISQIGSTVVKAFALQADGLGFNSPVWLQSGLPWSL